MNNNPPDASDPTWELKDALREEEAETDQEPSTSQDQEEAGSTYNIERMMDGGRERTSRQSEQENGKSNRLFRSSVVTTSFVLLLVSVFAYVAWAFGPWTTQDDPPNPAGTLSEQDVQSWLAQTKKLESALSRKNVYPHSTSILGFSSELSQRSTLKNVVKSSLSHMDFTTYRTITRDIGNTLKLTDTSTGSSPPETGTTGSVIQQNQQIVGDYRSDLHEIMKRLRNANQLTRRDTGRTLPPAEPASGPGAPEVE